MTVVFLSFLIGIIAGLRAMTAPAAISWAAYAGRIDVTGSWLAFLSYQFTPWIISLLAAGELVADQLPSTPSRKVPVQFGTRLGAGLLCGAAIGVASGWAWASAIAGIVGAAAGTYGGAYARRRLASRFESDHPGALLEDAVAIVGAFLILWGLA